MADSIKTESGPALSILGVNKAEARKAVTYLRNRGRIAFYNASDRSLNTFPSNQGRDADYAALDAAVRHARGWAPKAEA